MAFKDPATERAYRQRVTARRRAAVRPIPDLPGEEWRPVAGFDFGYEISNRGRLRRTHDNWGPKTKLIKPRLHRTGYWVVLLRCKAGTRGMRSAYIHRLVAAAFVPNPRRTDVVNHLNGIPTDNRAENLEWTTLSGNSLHAVRSGRMTPHAPALRGEESGKAKLTSAQVLEIRALRGAMRVGDIAARYGLAKITVYKIHRRLTWTHLP